MRVFFSLSSVPAHLLPNHPCGHTSRKSMGGNVVGDNGSGGNDGPVADGDTFQYLCPLPYPYMVADADGGGDLEA